jgi:hypothetical protein
MAIRNVPESTPTWRGGVRGMMIGAITGALFFAVKAGRREPHAR